MRNHIHINCDLGEGNTNLDKSIMPLIDACNIACGGHTGDVDSMIHSIELAQKHKVEIGAHPSYPDQDNFGRLSMDLSWIELAQALNFQWNSFKKIVQRIGATISHIKPHGALYNDCQKDAQLRRQVFNLMHSWDDSLYIFTNALITEKIFNISQELFLDRNYNKDQSLVSRQQENALISDPKEVIANLDRLIMYGELLTIDGTVLKPEFQTLCVHSDSPNALNILQQIGEYCKTKKIARGKNT